MTGHRTVLDLGWPFTNGDGIDNLSQSALRSAALRLDAFAALYAGAPLAPNKSGLRIQTNGSATITASGQIEVAGLQSTNAIWAIVLPSSNPTTAATVNYNGPGVTSVGTTFSTVIQAENDGAGPAIINAAGNMTGVALGAAANGITGLFASGGSSGTVNYTSGTIAVRGNFANGIYAAGDSATVNTAPGTTITVLSVTGERLKPGIALDAFGTAAANQALRATVESTIQMIGPAAPDSNVRNNGIGIRAFSFGDAPIFVTLTGNGSITTFGGNGIGIAALSGGGSINVTSIGQITTNGSGSIGIFADATNLVRSFPSEFRATPVFTGTPGTVEVNATNVTTTGQFSTGIVANGALGATVNIASGGSVNGGWQAGLTGGSGLFGLPAAGVILNSSGGTATLNNFGSIGALSDRAVVGDPVVINNFGTITGFVQFTGGGNSIENNGLFDLRHFAQTTPNGGRDTLRVAIADLGEGPGNTFNNTGTGTLRLAAVTGATTLDNTGEYLPLNNPNNSMAAPGGPLQGHLIGVNTFINSGTIDLQSNPVAGDVLVITGARAAGLPGTGTFISNGGTLRLDTVLNEGGAATRSDTLVVDGTSVGAGPTQMAIRNAGGGGALTVGDGILVTQVLDPTRSAPGAFSLQGGPITAGAFDYFLFKGGPSPGSEGNWYLRSSLVPGGTPAPGEPPLPTLAPGGSANPAVPARRRGDVSRAVHRAIAWLAHAWHLQRAPGRSAARAGRLQSGNSRSLMECRQRRHAR